MRTPIETQQQSSKSSKLLYSLQQCLVSNRTEVEGLAVDGQDPLVLLVPSAGFLVTVHGVSSKVVEFLQKFSSTFVAFLQVFTLLTIERDLNTHQYRI